MNFVINISRRSTYLIASLLLVAGVVIPVIVPPQSQAAQLTSRSLSISSSANGTISTDIAGNAVVAGAGGNGAKAKHTIKFTMATGTATIGSILIMYCNSPIIQSTCTDSTGLSAANLTSVAAGANNAATLTGLALDTTSTNATINSAIGSVGVCNGTGGSTTRDNCVPMKLSSGVAQTGSPVVEVAYGGGASNYITNPTTDNTAFYARLFVFQTTSYGTLVDSGGVAASTAQQVDITAKVQEVLNFSVGTTITATGGTCAPFTDTGALTLGDPVNGVLSTSVAYDARSYFRASSNTLGGTVIYYSGDTLKSGANSITSVGLGGGGGTTGVSSTLGTKQFGLALDPSDSSYSFTDLAANNGSNIASHLYNYSQGNGTITNAGTAKFQFDTASTTTPRPIAVAAAGIACDTGTVRYIGNVSTSTPAGIYTTTITYLATGTY